MGSIDMLFPLIILFITAILTFLLYPVWIRFVYKFHMGEEVRGDGPASHIKKIGTPTMGGMVFIFTVALVTLFLNRSRTQTLFPVFIACLSALFGLIEDFSKVYKSSGLPGFLSRYLPFLRRNENTRSQGRVLRTFMFPWRMFKEFWRVVGSRTDIGLQTHSKFIIQAVIGGFVAYWTYFKLGWDWIWLPLVGDIHIGLLYPVFIFLLFVLVLNFVAFTDGIDGLAGGLALIAFCSYWVVASVLNYNDLAAFSASFVGALIPFLYFNVFPARIFMGNVGSHVLGATLVLLSVVMHREIVMLFVSFMFLIDGVSSPLQQLSVKLTGKRIFRMAPLHHHFELLGWHETKVTLRFWLIGLFFAFVGIFISAL